MKIFKNANFISCEDDNKIYSVMIEDKGKINYLGNKIPETYKNIQSEDLAGKCVVPAFTDSHIHFESFSLFNATLDCRDVADFGELGDVIQKYINNHPKEKVILGFGCSAHTVKEKRLPALADLDKITSHPIIIIKYDGHAAVANAALINKLPSSVLKVKGFEPETGWFYQEAFYSAVNFLTKSVSILKVLKNLINGSDYMARKGIGLVHTVEGVGFPLDVDIEVMRIAALGLPQKFVTYFQTMDVNKVVHRKMPRIGGCFATALDGCFGSEDAALRAPYTNNTKNYGVLFYSQEQVNKFVKGANRAHLQISMHTIGDAAIEQALAAYEIALNDFPRNDHRHIIIHADLIDEPMIEKARSLGIHIATQTPFLHWNQEPMEYLQTIVGDRVEKLFPIKSMLDAGLTVANGSDGPCTLPDPIFGIYAACTHPNPDERISVIDALKMATIGGAKLSFDENDRGTLTVGKIADFVVLDKNPLKIDVEKIKDINIEALYLNGKLYSGQDNSSIKLLMQSLKNKLNPS